MTLTELIFFQASSMLILASIVQEYINLNKFSDKNIFADNITNKDLIASRIYAEIKDENSIFYLNPYMWSMLSISILGSYFIFSESYIFNILSILLFLYFIVQYFILILKVRKISTDEDTHNSIRQKLDDLKWEFKSKKIPLNKFTKSSLDKLGITQTFDKYGSLEFNGFFSFDEEKIFSKFKDDGDILFYDQNFNKYELVKSEYTEPIIIKGNISVSPIFAELNKPIYVWKKMKLNIVEGFVSITVLYLTIVGVSLF